MKTEPFSLKEHGLDANEVLRNLPPCPLYEPATAAKLAALFQENFKKYEAGVSSEVRGAGPAVTASAPASRAMPKRTEILA